MQSPPSAVSVSPSAAPEAYRPHAPRWFPSETLMVFGGVLIGVLVFGGLLALHAIYLIPVPCNTAYGYYCPQPTPDTATYGSIVRGLAWIGVGAVDVAAGLSVALAFVIGSRPEIAENTRRSVFTFTAVFVASWILGSLLLLNYLAVLRNY